MQYIQKPDPALCIAAVPKKKWSDPSSRCMPLMDWANACTIDRQLVNLAIQVFRRIEANGPRVPFIDTTENTILFTWDNDSEKQRRILYIELKVGMSLRYQVAVRPVVGGDHDWKYITDNTQVGLALDYLGQYIAA